LPEFVERMKAKLVGSHAVRQLDLWNQIWRVPRFGHARRHWNAHTVAEPKGSGQQISRSDEFNRRARCPRCKIDGEIVALDEKGRSSFQLLQGFDMGQERPPIVFNAFDLLRLTGKNPRFLPNEERKAKLEDLLKKPPGLIRYSVSFTKDVQELLSHARELGLEGLIGRRSGSRYEPGKRTGAWIKLKLHQEQEFVIGEYTEPEGSREYFGALLVGFHEGKKLKFAGRVGTGFNEKTS
jgi:ATP-dependent DNA ligase